MATTGARDGTSGPPVEPDRPPTNLLGSILVSIFCCLPFGIVAVVYGILVQTRWRAGDERGSRHASDMAEKWMYGGVGAAVLIVVIRLIMFLVSFFFGTDEGEASLGPLGLV